MYYRLWDGHTGMHLFSYFPVCSFVLLYEIYSHLPRTGELSATAILINCMSRLEMIKYRRSSFFLDWNTSINVRLPSGRYTRVCY